MRCFVGIPLDEATRDALTDAGATIRRHDPAWRAGSWVARDNLHITLAFLGEVGSDDLRRLVGLIDDEVTGTRPFALPLAGVGPVPSPGRGRMLWATFGDPEKRAEGLSRAVGVACAHFGLEVEERAFRAHATLVRVRRPLRTPESTLSLFDDLGRALPSFVSVASASLFSSTLSRTGPRYDVLHTWEFPTD